MSPRRHRERHFGVKFMPRQKLSRAGGRTQGLVHPGVSQGPRATHHPTPDLLLPLTPQLPPLPLNPPLPLLDTLLPMLAIPVRHLPASLLNTCASCLSVPCLSDTFTCVLCLFSLAPFLKRYFLCLLPLLALTDSIAYIVSSQKCITL